MGEFEFAPGAGFAYRPGELIVPKGHQERAKDALRGKWFEGGPRKGRRGPVRKGRFERFRDVEDTLESRDRLVEAGVPAQVNHVLFATGCCHGPCPPHPSTEGAEDFYKAHPFYANPFYANPFYANPFYANPFYANPFYANPFYANSQQRSTGVPRTSAVPAEPPVAIPEDARMGVAILDTGYASSFEPQVAPGRTITGDVVDQPDVDPQDTYLDTVAGHGTFIAGVIDRLADQCDFTFKAVISGRGDADEVEIADALEACANMGRQRPHFVNMSFAGYSASGMGVLADAVAEAQENKIVLVASAGNDATCFPAYPAALPGVVGVGAIDADGEPATFTNYGPWVRASAPGVDVDSLFFDGFTEPGVGDFKGWARWSGTSFAAPFVVGVLAARARAIHGGGNFSGDLFAAAAAAVETMIDNAADKHPMLGAIIT